MNKENRCVSISDWASALSFSPFHALLPLSEPEPAFQHSILTRKPLVKARVALTEKSQSKLIWNYLPVDIAQAASAKLDHILANCEFVVSDDCHFPH